MKLRNKKTGEIWTLTNRNEGTSAVIWVSNGSQTHLIESIEELANNFEDYEEPKEYWYIDTSMMEVTYNTLGAESDVEEFNKQIGNYFETEEEAEKAVEKLKAITRLNKCGFKFEGYTDRDRANGGDIVIYARINIPHNNLLEEAQPAMLKDLDLLFGGEQ